MIKLASGVFPGVGRHLPVLLLGLLFRPASTEAQSVTLKGHSLGIIEALTEVGKQAQVSFLYSPAIFKDAPPVDLDLDHVPPRKALHELFAGTRYRFDLVDEKIYSLSREPGPTPYAELVGTVTNTAEGPLAGATLTIENAQVSVVANAAGQFRMPVTGFHSLVTVSCAGYSTQTLLLSNKNAQDIRLAVASPGLDAVVIVGYGKTTQRLTTSTITKVVAEDIADEPVPNLLGRLEGRVSRLTIRRYNGVIGSAYATLLGGIHSIQQGNQPLFVLDGVPLLGGFLTPIGSGSAQGPAGASALNGIPCGDVASVEVLKDASATAIYGSRGANGVILITTKEGEAGRPRWTVDVSQGGSRVVKTSPLLNTSQFLALREEAVRNDGQKISVGTVPEAYPPWDSLRNSNYQRLSSGGTGSYRYLRAGFDGGGSRTRFLVSGSALNQIGVFPGTTKDQHLSLHGSLHHQSGRLTVGFSGLFDREDVHLPREDYTYYAYLAPNAPAFTNAAGQPQWGTLDLPYQNIPALGNNTYKGMVQNLFGRLQLGFALTHVLSIEGSIGGNSILAHEQSMQTIAGQFPGRIPPPTGNRSAASNNYRCGIAELMGRYSGRAGPGRLDAVAGVTYQGQRIDHSSLQLSGVPSDSLLAAGAGATTTTPGSDRVYYRYTALFGRANYIIRNKYLLTASGRRDGSSRFGPGAQFGNFWALGAGWIFSEENFIKKMWKGLSFGKIRGSYGTTGNDQTGEDQFAESYVATNSLRGYQGQQGMIPASLANDQLHWELYYRGELALDLGFWKDKIMFSAGAYHSHSRNQLVYIQLPPQVGFPGVLANQPANVVNKGLEFLLQVNKVRIGNWQWSSMLTLTIPRNYLASWPGLYNSLYAGTLIQGLSLTATKGLHFTGVDPRTGLYTFLDVNHNGKVDPGDFVPGPSLDPKWYGGWGHSLEYKGWGLDVFFEYRRQNGVNPLAVLDQRNAPGMQGPYQLSNGPKEWLPHWRQPGDLSNRQMLTASPGSPAWVTLQEYLQSDATIIDASFLRLKTLALHYQFQKPWLERRRLRGLQLFVQGQNLWTKTRFPVTDPETQDPTVLPPLRTLVAGFHLSF